MSDLQVHKTKAELQKAEKLFNALLEDDENAIAEELEKGANPNLLLPEEGITPFHYVVGGTEDRRDLTALFLCYHANPNVRSSEGLTPLHVASTWGREESVRLLLQNGAGPDAQDEMGQTALEMAFEKGHLHIVSIIQAAAALLEIQEEPEVPHYIKTLRCIREVPTEGVAQDVIDEVTYSMGNLMRDSSFEPETVDLKETHFARLRTAECGPRENCLKSYDPYTVTDCQGISCVDDIVTDDNCPHIKTDECGVSDLSRDDASTCSCCSVHANENVEMCLKHIDPQNVRRNSNEITLLVKMMENFTFSNHRIDVTSPDHPRIQIKGDHDGISDSDDTIVTSSSDSYHTCEESANQESFVRTGKRDQHDTGGGGDGAATCKTAVIHRRLNETFTVDSEGNGVDTLLSRQQRHYIDNHQTKLREPSISPQCSDCSSEKLDLADSTLIYNYLSLMAKSPQSKHTAQVSPASGVTETNYTDLRPMAGRRSVPETNFCGLPLSDSLLSEDISLISSDRSSCRSSLSDATVIYEYQYTDTEDGHELIEQHFCPRSVTPSPNTSISSCKSGDSVPSVASSVGKLDNHQVRQMLQNLGDAPGPVTDSTRLLYLRRLKHLKKHPSSPRRVVKPTSTGYSRELEAILQSRRDLLSNDDIAKYDYEQEMISSFSDPTRVWREGSLKASFNYLLLDSSITQNLPMASNLSQLEKFRIFISSVFYIGKGKRSRPYCHFYQALDCRKKGSTDKVCDKVERILDIWNQNLGVVSLHVFQNVIPVEAYTREAAMIDTIGMAKLTNIRKGDYYGVASTWMLDKKRSLGTFLLVKAFNIFLLEGERQIQPGDIKVGE